MVNRAEFLPRLMSDSDPQQTQQLPGPAAHYDALRAAGELRADPAQEEIVQALERMHSQLAAINRRGLRARFSKIFTSRKTATRQAVEGIYIHGAVGRGKSMLMDLFFESAPLDAKRRVHFHEFMLECHAALHAWRNMTDDERRAEGWKQEDKDAIPPLARRIARQSKLLCFDEFQINDIADAMILGRLLEALLRQGIIIVATSNRAPSALYEGGLNRSLFTPFIALIEERLQVLALDGPTDYRLLRMKGLETYLTPVDQETTNQLREAFFRMTDHDVEDAASVPSGEIEVQGRSLFVPKCLKGVAVFSFKRLCCNPLGAHDYLAIAWRYHTVFIVAIPRLGREKRDEARRFTALIDILYENGVKLFCSAEVAPEELYIEGDGTFEFARTVSRLREMQSADYLQRGHAT